MKVAILKMFLLVMILGSANNIFTMFSYETNDQKYGNAFMVMKGMYDEFIVMNKKTQEYNSSPSNERLRSMNNQINSIKNKINELRKYSAVSSFSITALSKAYTEAKSGIVSGITLLKVAQCESNVLMYLYKNAPQQYLPDSAFKDSMKAEERVHKLQKRSVK